MAENSESENDKVPLLREKPIVNYTKRYDQVSWRSADTDFEQDPSASSADEIGRARHIRVAYPSRRKQKIAALIIVVLMFLGIMGGLIYLYVAKVEDFVEIDCGKISGVIQSTSFGKDQSKYMYVYKGIPFAMPPLQQLRWKPPASLPNGYCGKDIFKADSFGAQCAGGVNKSKGAEDCLYLNVYTSTAPKIEGSRPVVVYFQAGYSMQSDDFVGTLPFVRGFSAAMDVVTVTVNYRLNAFGFLTIKELWKSNSSYGNYGIQDQILGLKWVQKNIKVFGGDPSSVTIIGETSVFALIAAPKANGLFHKAISLSGSPNFDTSYKQASENNRKFLPKSKCASFNSSKLKKCLHNLTTVEVLESFNWDSMNRWDFPEKDFLNDALVVTDPIVLPTSPKYISQNQNTKKVSLLVGSTAQEIGLKTVNRFNNKSLEDYKKYLSERLKVFSVNFPNIVLDQLYSNITNHPAQYVYETITSDIRVICPTNKLKSDIAKSSSHVVYRYIFDCPLANLPSVFQSDYSFHGLDLLALFTTDAADSKYIAGEVLRKNFKHFIEFGHPAELGWDSDKTGVLDIEGKIEVLNGDYHENQCQFWNDPKNGFVPYSWKN